MRKHQIFLLIHAFPFTVYAILVLMYFFTRRFIFPLIIHHRDYPKPKSCDPEIMYQFPVASVIPDWGIRAHTHTPWAHTFTHLGINKGSKHLDNPIVQDWHIHPKGFTDVHTFYTRWVSQPYCV